MKILLYKIPQYSDLQIGLQVCYKSLNGGQLNQSNVTALSNEFSRIVSSWCSIVQLTNINRLNSTEEYTGCCATHEYYDTNEAMLQAFTKTFDREFTFFNDEIPESEIQYAIDIDYFNAAWQLSKKNKFVQPVFFIRK